MYWSIKCHYSPRQNPESAPNSCETYFQKCVNRVTKKKEEAKLPSSFELPINYPSMVMAGLEKGLLSGKGKTKFISSVAGAMFKYKSYPTSAEYEMVGTLIIKKYPFLRSSCGTGYVICVNGVPCNHYLLVGLYKGSFTEVFTKYRWPKI